MSPITVINENKLVIRNDNIVHFDKINNIYHLIAKGEQTPELANAHLYIIKNILKTSANQISFLINLNECGKNSLEANNIWKHLTKLKQTKKVALFGIHPVAKVIAYFYMGALIKKDKVSFFYDENKALSWIKK